MKTSIFFLIAFGIGANALIIRDIKNFIALETDAINPACHLGGSACPLSSFYNHHGGKGGSCGSCPKEDTHCEDFGDAMGLCQETCFKKGLEVSLPLKDSWVSWKVFADHACQMGGCCGEDILVAVSFWEIAGMNTPKSYLPYKEYACGCGWFQTRIRFDDDNCKTICGGFYDGNCKSNLNWPVDLE